MLKEYKNITQDDSTSTSRRWFKSKNLDLTLWMENGNITMFQLGYKLENGECLITWSEEKGFLQNMVDDGESSPLKNLSPIAHSEFDAPLDQIIFSLNEEKGGDLDCEIIEFIVNKMKK